MTTETAKPRWARSPALVCAVLLALFGLLSYSAAWTKSPTSDEPLHAAAGYLIRWCGDYRIDIEDPALFPLLSSLPQSQSDLQADTGDSNFRESLKDHRKQGAFVVQMMFRTPHVDPTQPGQISIYDGPAYIDRARVIFLAIALAGGAMLAWWANRLAGATAAILATALFSLDPNFLANGPLIKNDVAIAVLMLWLMAAVWLFGQRGTWLRLLAIALACAIAVNIKFSGLLLPVLLGVMLTVRSVMPPTWTLFGRRVHRGAARLLISGSICIAVILGSWGAIWLVYRCRYSMGPTEPVLVDRGPFVMYATAAEMIAADPAHQHPTAQQVMDHPPSLKTRLVLWLDDHRLLPHAWSMGLLYSYLTTLRRSAFVIGQYSETGWWYYFPLAMLFKTPLAVLILGLALSARGIIGRFRNRASSGPVAGWTACCLGIPIALYGVVAMSSNLNIGIRHILPIIPFIYLLMSTALATWITSGARWPRIAAIGLIVMMAIESLACWPNYLAFFNVACGSARGGIRLLGDSNLDWGQDLPLLAQWQQQHPDRLLYLSYNGTDDPKYYGVRYVQVGGGYGYSDQPVEPMDRPGVFAISATNLQGIYYSESARARIKTLLTRPPIAVLGGTIYLYDWNPKEFSSPADRSAKP